MGAKPKSYGMGLSPFPVRGGQKWTKNLNIGIFKGEPKIVVTLSSLNSKIFGFGHWLLNWPGTSPTNFWVRAQRKTAQNGPKTQFFKICLIIIQNWKTHEMNVYSTTLAGCWQEKVVSVFGFGPSKSFLGTWTWSFLAKIANKIELQARTSKMVQHTLLKWCCIHF